MFILFSKRARKMKADMSNLEMYKAIKTFIIYTISLAILAAALYFSYIYVYPFFITLLVIFSGITLFFWYVIVWGLVEDGHI